MDDRSERDLVTRAQGGDVDAIGMLYDQHYESIFRYLWLRVNDLKLAEDLTGDVFMRMLSALPRYQPMGMPFRAWLYRIAHNLLVDHWRKPGNCEPIPLDLIEEQTDDGDLSLKVERNFLVAHVSRAMTQLEPNQHEVIVLRFVMGLSLQEVARAVGKTEGAVKSLQHRGLAALRLALKPGPEQVRHDA